MEPRVVVKVTAVPLWGGVPLASITCAMRSVDPLVGNAVVEAVSVIVDPVGASSGTLSQATLSSADPAIRTTRAVARRRRDIMNAINILIPMHLAGQGKRDVKDERNEQSGYAMAALLVALSVMAIMMTVVMPVWKQTSQREKEEELVFRGKQYVHAIGMFQRKFANAYPPNIDVLVDQRFLRKKFKDPITNDDFVPIPAGQAVPGTQAPGPQRGGTSTTAPGGRGQTPSGQTTQPGAAGRTGGPPISSGSIGQTSGGIQGVTSKSKDQSIRLYNGRGHYNEWAFVYIQQQQAAGGGAAGSTTPGPNGGNPRGGPNGGNPRGGPNGPFPRGGSPFGPNGPGGPGGRGGAGGIGTFDGRGVTPVMPPSTPRGRF
jgi:type II secretory pathway pseudopilin PulG